MPIGEEFQKQFALLDEFMDAPGAAMRIVRIDQEFEDFLLKALLKKDEDDHFPHFIIPIDDAFESQDQYCQVLLDTIKSQYETHKADIEAEGIHFTVPYSETDDLSANEKFTRYVCALADAMLDDMGSLVFLCYPPSVGDPEQWRLTWAMIMSQTTSDWVKFIVYDSRTEPRLDDLLDKSDNVSDQTFYVDPADLETKVRKLLEDPSKLTPIEHRRYLAMVGSFDFSNRKYDTAVSEQRELVTLCEDGGEPPEVASAYYNLGNTYLAQKQFEQADDSYLKCIDISLEHEINGMLPMAYINLGVSMHRQEAIKEAIQCMKVARDYYQALNNPPGEAYALDCLAQLCFEQRAYERAEEFWVEAYKIWDGMTGSHFEDARTDGGEFIADKLRKLYEHTNQIPKIHQLNKGEIPGATKQP
jgi:tetratricopeptide (TPR) repeat protein